MKTLVRIVSLVLLVMIAPMSVIAGNSQSKTITVKKFPKNPKDDGKDGYRTPSRDIVGEPITMTNQKSYRIWEILHE